jgi:hypothetical protein
MSFTAYDPTDVVISSDSVVSGMWDYGSNVLTTFFTSSTQAQSTKYYYLDIYASSSISSSLEFDLQYGHISGSGSININPSVPNVTPSLVVYGQYLNTIYESVSSSIMDASGNSLQDFWIINIARSKYKESIQPGSLTLLLSGSSGLISLTDNSPALSITQFIGDNIYYDIVSGSSNNVNLNVNSKYGYLFPDLGIILLNPAALSGYVATPSRTPAGTDGQDSLKLFNSISLGANFMAQSDETISSCWFFTRVKNTDYNYTTNPSIIDQNGNLIFTDLINNPQTFFTTVGLYNNNGDLLAVAKLSKPLQKNFTSEALIRIKLSF